MVIILKPALIFCSETCCTNNINDNEIALNNYKIVRCDSHSRHTGGVIIYIHESIDFNIKYNDCINNNIWCIFVKLKHINPKWQIGVVYHSPSTSDADFINYLRSVLDQCCENTDNNILIGDFNINTNVRSTYSIQLTELLSIYNMKQIIDFNTRITENSATKIDLLFTNSNNILCKKMDDFQISDHETILFNIKSDREYQMRKTVKIISWQNYSKDNLINNLRFCYFGNFKELDLNTKVLLIKNKYSDVMHNLTNEKEVKVKVMNKWYDSELADLNKQKLNLFTEVQTNGNWTDYRILKNKYKKMVRIKKVKYLENQIDRNCDDSKKMWSSLKKAINMKTEITSIDKILVEGAIIEGDINIANSFNRFFVNSIVEINNKIDIINNVSLDLVHCEGSFSFDRVTVCDIEAIVSKFKRKLGGKKLMSEGVLKDSISYTAHFYAEIINESMSEGIFPSIWKTSVIVPIPKIKNTFKVEEFRPINTLPCDEKILETVIKTQLVRYLEDKKVIINEQSGFRNKHSCESALNLVLANFKDDLNNKCSVISVFVDLKRAFETIDQNMLLKKLNAIGIRNKELNWFRSFLTDRKQCTIIGSSKSEDILVELGLPQGSVLAPILFNIYINDIVKALRYSKIKLFADDALITISGSNEKDIFEKLQQDLDSLYKWLCINKLKINIEKTKYMIITRKNNFEAFSLTINNTILERVESIMYLGIHIDNKLNFNDHIDYTISKIAKQIGFLKRSCKFLSKKYKILVYKSIIEPHFIYCPTVFFIMKDSQIAKLQILQNKVMRFILRKPFDTHIKDMLNSLNWLNIKQLIYFHTMKFIFKIINGLLPDYLRSQIQYNFETHNRNLRNNNKFKLPMYRTESEKNNLFYKGLKCFNELPENIVNNNFVKFKSMLFNYCKTYS